MLALSDVLPSARFVGLLGGSTFLCSYAAISREFLGERWSTLLMFPRLVAFFSGDFLLLKMPVLPAKLYVSAVKGGTLAVVCAAAGV